MRRFEHSKLLIRVTRCVWVLPALKSGKPGLWKHGVNDYHIVNGRQLRREGGYNIRSSRLFRNPNLVVMVEVEYPPEPT